MTAHGQNPRQRPAADGSSSVSDSVIEGVARLCRSAVGGRRAARALAEWARRFELSDAEFQVLWQLRAAPPEGRCQTALASELAVSPAQVSATVERLRAKNLIALRAAPGDRRRNLWLLSSGGQALLEKMLGSAALLRAAPLSQFECADSLSGREEAA